MTDRLCVVQTLKTGALSQLAGFDFNSLAARKDGKFLAAKEDGLFLISGTTYDGTAIPAFFEFTVDFGQVVQINQLFIGLETSGRLKVNLTFNENTTNTRSYYIDPADINLTEHTAEVDVGGDDWGRFLTISIENVSGCDFSIDTIDAVTVPLGRWRVW